MLPPDLQQIVSGLAHAALAEMLKAGLRLGDGDDFQAVARSDEGRAQLLVRLCLWEGPARFIPAPGVESPAVRLRPIEQCALEAAPAPDGEPVSIKRLATLAGYGCNGHFREAVRRLVDLGKLLRVTGGVRRAR